jgi:predicted lysophospholipase L1 biosynthesis ABC-type transport system permease subunit
MSITARRRAFELAALRTVGVRRATLLRASVVEQFLLLFVGAALGTAAALVAFVVGASAVPQFSDATPVQLSFAADPGIVASALGAIALLTVAGAVVAGRLLLRAARPALLREAAP